MINGKKIKARMVELGLTQKMLAKLLEIAQPTLNLKLNGKRPMTISEAELLCNILNIDNSEIGLYFFNNKIA